MIIFNFIFISAYGESSHFNLVYKWWWITFEFSLRFIDFSLHDNFQLLLPLEYYSANDEKLTFNIV